MMRVLVNIIKPLIFFLFGCLLLSFAIKGIDLSNFTATLSSIPIYLVGVSMFLGYLAFVFRGLRWQLLINPLGFSPRRTDLIHSIAFGYLFNSFIPRSGELARCTALNRTTGIPVSTLFGHVLLERLIDFILLALCILLSIVLNYKDVLQFVEIISIPRQLITYIFFFIALIIIIYKTRKFFLTKVQLQQISSFTLGIKTGFTSIKNIPNKLLFFTYTVLIWICYLFMSVVCFYCFNETQDLNLGHGLFVLVAGGLGMVVPTPTGIGSYHYLVIQALMILNISREVSQFFAIIVHSSQALMIIISGFLAMLILYNRKRKNHE
ncbi:MAG: hypothetical protein CMD26_04415 [Flavobacteriales bacterium]|nr:hypothetical protein [Flavobacteriales bacterium]